MYFVDEEHAANFELLLIEYKVSNGNSEYRAALYVLALPEIYRKTHGQLGRYPFVWKYEHTPPTEERMVDEDGSTYILHGGEDEILDEDENPTPSAAYAALSSGYRQIVELAHNLYNSRNEFNLTDGLDTWGDELFRVFIQAVAIRTGRDVRIPN